MRRLALAAALASAAPLTAGPAAGDGCWGGEFSEALCCGARWGLTGNPACWNEEFTYLRCCGLASFPRCPEEDAWWDSVAPPVEDSGEEFDFVVVGAGSAGSVVAARLAAAEGPGGSPWRVLLLDAGPWDAPEDVADPDSPPSDGSRWRVPLSANWSFDAHERVWNYSTGQGLGGTSAVNSMIYTRGSLSEYEAFGWSEAEVLEAYLALEARMEVPGFAPNFELHSRLSDNSQAASEPGYPLTLVSATPEELPALFRAVIEAFADANVPFRIDPHSASSMHGVGGMWRSMGCEHPRCQPTRVSRFQAAKGRPRASPYTTLVAPLNRTGGHRLRVTPHAEVDRIVFNSSKHVVGVVVSTRGDSEGAPPRQQLVRVAREAIVSAGVFSSPKILTLSGIAEPEELERLGIPLVASSPEVSRHFREHVGLSIVVGTSVPCPRGYHQEPGGRATHLGNLDQFIGQLYAFLNSTENSPGAKGPMEAEVMVLEGCLEDRLSLTFTIILLRSGSSGRLVVRSRNPTTAPHLDYQPLSHAGDLEAIARVVRLLYTKVFASPALAEFELSASPEWGVVADFWQLAKWIRGNLYYYAHPYGTCRIGREGAPGVVDSRLRVAGVRGLRVADASVFPESPSGHFDAPSRLAGQLAARFALEDWAAESAGGAAAAERAREGGPSLQLRGYAGVGLPLRGLGTNGFEGERAAEAVLRFLRAGGRHIDTGLLYNNHASIRAALSRSGVRRESIFITSKIPPSEMGMEEAGAAVDRMVEELGTHVDLVLIHWPANFDDQAVVPACARPPGSWSACRLATWLAMERALRAGKARALGVSNFGVRHLGELLDARSRTMHVAVNQVEFHPWWPQPALRKLCAQRQIALVAYGSLGGSLIGGAMLHAPAVVKVAADRQKSPAQVLLRWAVQQGVAVVPSSSSEEHLAQNLDVVDWELDSAQMAAVGAVAPGDRMRVFLPDPENAP